jgi:hypothetical protein
MTVKSPKSKIMVKRQKENNDNSKKRFKYGTKEGTNIMAAEGKLFFYLGNLTMDTDVNNLKNYIEELLHDNLISIEELKSRNEKEHYTRRSFKVVTSTKHMDVMYNMDNWPKRMILRKYRRPKLEDNKNKSNANIPINNQEQVKKDKLSSQKKKKKIFLRFKELY